MAKKNKKVKSTNYTPVSNRPSAKSKMNEFMRNQPLLYIIIAVIAFIGGNYLFDLIAKFF